MHNENSLDTLAAALAYAMGIEPPKYANEANKDLTDFIDRAFDGEKCDRIVMYNTDAIGEWIYRKYPDFVKTAREIADVEIPMATVMPSVTPVCFGTMYTGAQPAVHGIQKYEKPVIKIDTLFDALIRRGKKIAIISYTTTSMGKIFRERDIDYFHFEDGDIEDVCAKGLELILRDEHDFIVIYNGNYDSIMHKKGPESPEALAELRQNASMYKIICRLIEANKRGHKTLVGFAMDHGSHEIDEGGGAHGLDMDEDINIVHLYKAIK